MVTLTEDSSALASMTRKAPSLFDLVRDEFDRKGSASRETLETIARRNGIPPHKFTSELRRLRKHQHLSAPYEIESTIYRGRPTHVYAPGTLEGDTLEQWRIEVEHRHRFLSTKELKKAGEQYARGVFRRARDEGASWVRRVPQSARLGKIPLPNGLKADLIVGYGFAGAHFDELLVEVKNAREHFDISSPIFPKLLQSALDTDRVPALVVAHISPRAATFCEDAGIALLHLGRRIIDRKKRREARDIFGNYADEEFQFVRLQRIFAEPISTDIRLHIQHVRQVDWLATADQRWYENRQKSQRVVDPLSDDQWQAAAREIASESPSEGF